MSLDTAPDAPEAGPATVGAVDRAVDVLLLFGRSLQPSLGVTEIATELGMPKSGVHRVLTTLRRRRLVTYDPETRKYALGQAAIALSQSYITRLDVQAMATGVLRDLMARTGETATLAVRRHGSVIYRAQAVPEHELRLEVRLTKPSPIHAGASGKAFLAFLPPEETEDYLGRAGGTLEAVTPRTITDPDALRSDLALARARGWATSTGERLVGVSALAAPVFDYEGYAVAVLAVAGPSARLSADDADAAKALRDATAQLSAEMGHSV